MKFGIFYELQLPKPWGVTSEHRLVKESLNQITLADKLGFDYIWEVEHHFLEEYSHSSAPEVFLSAVSQITSNIRLGHGIVQLPGEVNHPARVAERIAMLDLVSDGRVDFGTGESSSEIELGGFNVNRDTKRQQWEQSLQIIADMFVQEPFSGVKTDFFSIPPRNVIPKPIQKPHPPLWVACSRRETIHLAATKGIGALSFAFVEPEQAKEFVDDYYETIFSSNCKPIGKSINANVACVLPLMCHEDEGEAIKRGIDGAHFFGYSLAYYYVFGSHRPGKSDIYADFLKNRSKFGFDKDVASMKVERLGANLVNNGLSSLRGAIGTPDQIRDLIKRYETAGIDQLIFVSQCGNNQHDHIIESLNLFAKEVMPEFKTDRRKETEARTQKVRLLNDSLNANTFQNKENEFSSYDSNYSVSAVPKA